MKSRFKIVLVFMALQIGMLSGCGGGEDLESGQDKKVTVSKDTMSEKTEKKKEKTAPKKAVQVKDISFSRISNREIEITWSDQNDPLVKRYMIKRRKTGEERWQTLDTQMSDGKAGGRELSFVDGLQGFEPQQYEYRIDVKVEDDTRYEAREGEPVLGSNVLVCLDPGHYEGQNAVETDGIRYVEGDFVLELAKELKQVLGEEYGITAYLTRESGTIGIGGYTNADLDQNHVTLRGEYAKGSNLFLSLHTNVNQEGANGTATNTQSIEITKPIIVMGTEACESVLALDVANAVGIHLAEVNAQMGIAMPGKFRSAGSRNDITQWTEAFNDSLGLPGTVCYRSGEYGDYYGVLKGAADVGVPGMIIEHGFHTVPRMRELAAQGELKAQWAKADAAGIAEGFGMEEQTIAETPIS